MKNILLVGAGQLGSRHLQGIVSSNLATNVIVIDPLDSALQLSKNRVKEVEAGNARTKVSYSNSLGKGEDIDVAIIATTANFRFQAAKEILNIRKFRKIIFEKVLFQKEQDYRSTEKLIKKNNIYGYVNCPRRLYPIYKRIGALIKNEPSIKMFVSGSNWGLACNAIHFIDLFAYLSGKIDFELDDSFLQSGAVKGKRPGYYEVMGSIKGSHDKNNYFELNCIDQDSFSLQIRIETPNYEIELDEVLGKASISNQLEKIEEPFFVPYQSQLTGEVLMSEKFQLTPYLESQRMHLPLIKLLQNHIEQSLGKKLDCCPIT